MLDLESSFTVAMTRRRSGSFPRPSTLPLTSHWRTTWPPGVNSTIVLSRLPVLLGSPCEPTPFWNPTKRRWPSAVMSSGWVNDSDLGLVETDGTNLWLSVLPDRICRTSKCDEWCCRAPAAPWFDAAAATVAPAMSRLAGTTAAARTFAVRRVIGSMWPRFSGIAGCAGTLTDPSYWGRPTRRRPLQVRPVNARPSLADFPPSSGRRRCRRSVLMTLRDLV